MVIGKRKVRRGKNIGLKSFDESFEFFVRYYKKKDEFISFNTNSNKKTK